MNKIFKIIKLFLFLLIFIPNGRIFAAEIIIKNDTTGGDCVSVGNWDMHTKTCTLTQNINGIPVTILGSGIKFDGASHVVNGDGSFNTIGIRISGYFNTIRNLNVRGFWWGIHLSTSNSNIISDVEVSDNNVGIQNTVSSNYNRFERIRFIKNNQGITLSASKFNTILDSYFENNNGNAITVAFADNNVIEKNIMNNQERGMVFQDSYKNNVLSNIISGGYYGLTLERSGENILRDNVISGSVTGLDVGGTDNGHFNNVIDTTNFVDNKAIYYFTNINNRTFDEFINPATFYCIHCSDITIKNISISGEAKGIFLWESQNVSLENLNIFNNYQGIVLRNSNNNHIQNSEFKNNKQDDVLLINSSDNLVENNIFNSKTIGLQLYDSDNNIIKSNLVSVATSSLGLILTYSENNIINLNTISNTYNGLTLTSSGRNKIYNNNFINNVFDINSPTLSNDNIFNDDLPVGGNYWSHYQTPLQGCGDADLDGLCDMPYKIRGAFNSLVTGIDYFPWTVKNGWENPVRPPQSFWSSIQNSPAGWLNLRNTPGTQNKLADDVIKTLPNGWVIKVINITDENSDYVDVDGYRWYKVQDVTDGTIGWLPAKNLSDGTIYLNYDSGSQSNWQSKAEIQLNNSSDRKSSILEAVNNYFTKNNSDNSLYGGGGGLDGRNNFQTFIRGSNFPKELILSIAAQESGSEFNNEICSWAKDGGIGVMQITSAWFKGLGGGLNNIAHKDDCYASWVGNVSKYYSNAAQGVYANIKDGFRVLQDKYRRRCPNENIIIDGYEFTCQDVERILTTWGYNGFAKDKNTGLYSGHYLKYVANKLRNIGTYFNGTFYANNDRFIEKLEVADSNKQVIKLYSPATFHVVDERGRVTGLLNDAVLEEIPNSLYERDAEGAVIFFPARLYRYRVVGKTDGAYSFSVDFTNRGVLKTFKASDIDIVAGEVHEYVIDWDALGVGGIGVTINIDQDGDGVIDRIFVSGDTFSQTDIFLQDNADIDIDPDTINLRGNGKFITAYIELPDGFDVNDIVTHSVRLNQVVSPAEQPITINDYDKDAVSDLMVKFRREDVTPSLVVNNSSADIFVVGKIMWNDRINYWGGRDAIKIIR